jgi:cytochrome c peroxidase
VITKYAFDRDAFKTPTLRDIARTAPYMHDGRFQTLEEVVDFYDKGGIRSPWLAEKINVLAMTDDEKRDLVTFLKEGFSSDAYPRIAAPSLPPDEAAPGSSNTGG